MEMYIGVEDDGKKRAYPACPLGLALHAPTPSFAPMKYSLAKAASSPFVHPLINSPFTLGLRSRLRWCVLSGSLNDPEGGDKNGGGKGRGARLAKSEMPVSNLYGSLGSAGMVRSWSWAASVSRRRSRSWFCPP